jgi:hypothetical protein
MITAGRGQLKLCSRPMYLCMIGTNEPQATRAGRNACASEKQVKRLLQEFGLITYLIQRPAMLFRRGHRILSFVVPTEKRIRHMPIVEGPEKHLLGVVSIRDMLETMVQEKKKEKAELQDYIGGSY